MTKSLTSILFRAARLSADGRAVRKGPAAVGKRLIRKRAPRRTATGGPQMIPDAAVEAAKVAMETVTPPPGVSKSDWLAEHGRFALIAGALAAAAPYLMAQAWDEGASWASSDSAYWPDENPYRSRQ